MLQANATRNGPAPCPGVVDQAGAVRDGCRVCGKCDDLIRVMMQDIVAAPGGRKQERTPATALA
jgi:hypothetical protein